MPTRYSELAGLDLTSPELAVLRLMAEGYTNTQIGRALFVSENTVKAHTMRLRSKIGARDRAHAVAIGIARGHIALPHDATPIRLLAPGAVLAELLPDHTGGAA
jgi:DNA-binding NarL/FixJ family response regulator